MSSILFSSTGSQMSNKRRQFVHSGHFAAEVEVNPIPDDGSWGPYLTKDDALKLNRVRLALKRGDIEAASRDARVFELLPISA